MSKSKLIKKLAQLYGIKLEYFDISGKLQEVSVENCLKFLELFNINTSSEITLKKEINKIELDKWQKILPPVLVLKHNDIPLIKFRIPEKKLNQSFRWVFTEENGQNHSGELIPAELTITSYRHFKDYGTFYEFELPLPIETECGYHDLEIYFENKKISQMKLIVTPEKCYLPESFNKNKKIWGPKIRFNTIRNKTNLRTADANDLKYLIKFISRYKAGIIGIGAINQVMDDESGEIDFNLPSSRNLINTLYLNVETIISFIGDKSVQVKILSDEFQQSYKKLKESESVDFQDIYDLKYKILKIIYFAFRENHINNKTSKAWEFYNYIKFRGKNFRKLALFEALREHLINEDAKFRNWENWPESYKNPDSETVISFENSNKELLEFYMFLQWRADMQLAEAGLLSFHRKLDVGIFTELPLYIEKNGADAWAYQEFYNFNAYLKKQDEFDKENFKSVYPEIPKKLKNYAYEPIIDILRINMKHSGAIKISDLSFFEHRKWFVKDNNDEYSFIVKYPFEDIIGIIALESQRNRCIIVTDDSSCNIPKIVQTMLRFNILKESDFNFEEINSNEQMQTFITSLKTLKVPESEKTKTQGYKIAKIPCATYRIQFNKNFTFKDAIKIVPYLKNLGISHCYASPLLKARSDSTHGYDIVDHNSFNQEIGMKEDFYEFIDVLHNHNMGLILDIVPNHMGIGNDNIWWMDVLENGQSSSYASYFDIDWHPPKKELQGKVLIPVLGDHYGNILSNGELKLNFNIKSGKINLSYYEHKFPINPSSYPIILEYRLDVLASRIGRGNNDFLEYQSIITEFKNLPVYNALEITKVRERIREKEIAYSRLGNLCRSNSLICDFIRENLNDFEVRDNDEVTCNRLHQLLEEQAYRLAYWRVSVDEINYRRFFDVNDLAGLCIENPAVFASTHNFILDLIEQKAVDGLRIDHPDGLLDPTNYFLKLQQESAKRLGIEFDVTNDKLLSDKNLPIYIIVEKILAPFEKIPTNWAIHEIGRAHV
ncbi:MAG: 4-alpha-glucanotransferase [Candidatus Gastranaerophilales bacterium]|nr:4-alpha-glucanotransferase [Candidatus Gastranaerophilales bacterium]